jgi:hypothetical protein
MQVQLQKMSELCVYVTMYNTHNVDGNTIFQHNSTFSGLTVIKLGSAMLHTTSDD